MDNHPQSLKVADDIVTVGTADGKARLRTYKAGKLVFATDLTAGEIAYLIAELAKALRRVV